MANGFKRPGDPDYNPLEQTEVRSEFREPTGEISESLSIGPTRAELLINSYDKTIEFMKWLESLIDDDMKEIVVEVNKEEQPEVWMAMQRIFSNPSEKLTYNSYTQVLNALSEIESIEYGLSDPFKDEDEFIEKVISQDFLEPETDTSDMSVESEDIEALNAATTVQEFVGGSPTVDPEKLAKAKAYLSKLKQKIRWWKNWQFVWRFSRSYIKNKEEVNKRREELLALSTEIQELENAIYKAEKLNELEPLYALVKNIK